MSDQNDQKIAEIEVRAEVARSHLALTYGDEAATQMAGDVLFLLAETRRFRSEVAARDAVIAELVGLKDGPRNADYEARKPVAWERARAILRAHAN